MENEMGTLGLSEGQVGYNAHNSLWKLGLSEVHTRGIVWVGLMGNSWGLADRGINNSIEEELNGK